jgi:hypothetical protein
MKIKFICVILLIISIQVSAQQKIYPLSGTWHFRLDSLNAGLNGKWMGQPFKQELKLPGTLDDAGIGQKPTVDTNNMNKQVMTMLSRKHSYVGVVWYRKEILIPAPVKNAEIFLERVIWKTDCWIDGRHIGTQESLIAPHCFNAGDLKAGKHLIVLRIDNSRQHEISINNMSHAYTEGTQIIWNGVIGKMQLVGRNAVNINNIQLHPDLAGKEVKANFSIEDKNAGEGQYKIRISVWDKARLVGTKLQNVTLKNGLTAISTSLKLKTVKPWEELSPNLYGFTAELSGMGNKVIDKKTQSFGFRQLSNKNGLMQVNGHRIFLRGTLDCNVYPLEGHPPMNKQGWIKVFNTAKNYGLNHIRFHSWCPPEAAFAVADSLGFYLHVELPLWSLEVGKDKPTLGYLEDEAQRIIANYGNHPSFCFWSMGNELQGDFDWLNNLVSKLKKQDNRRLYTATTFSFQQGHGKWPEPVDDYYITQYTKKGWVRGQGIFNSHQPNFETDYSKSVDSIPVPLVIHEVGQYSVYPDMTEIRKYTGVLDPLNFKAVRHDLQKKHMLPLASQFLRASGKFAANLYKEEIERALKTPGVSGFQLLDLHDFPGQGTALVGILNAFWESKGLIKEEEFRQFCSPVVPLLRFKKAAYANDEKFTANGQLANFSSHAISVEPVWTITNAERQVLYKGKLKKSEIAVGNNNDLGEFTIDLSDIKTAGALTVTLSIPQANSENTWKIWVYPKEIIAPAGKAKFTTSVDEALTELRNGGVVVLNPDTANIKGVAGRFAPVFWSPVHFPDQPGTMGLLCDPHHPALRNFPTAFYSDWQWWDLVTRSKTMIIDELPAGVNPIVRVIDNFFKNRKMADIIELQVGQGKLILCSMDIHTRMEDRPAARQLKFSLMSYANSTDFTPALKVSEDQLRQLFK